MNQTYYNAVSKMEEMSVNREYLLGWVGGYLQNPMLEEQRVTETYEAGYADGSSKNTDNFAQYKG